MSSGISNQCLSKGNKEFKADNYLEAIKYYTEGLETFNFSNLSQITKNEIYKSTNKFVICALLNKRSECYLKLNEFENCLKDLLQIEIAKPQAKIIFQIAEIYFEKKKYRISLQYYNKAKQLNQIYLLGKEGEKIKLCEEKAKEELKFIPLKEDQLVEEILFQIFIFLNEFDLKKISRTCSQFKSLTENQEIWKTFLKEKDEKYFNFLSSSFDQSSNKKINWKNIYYQKYLFSDLYFINDFSIRMLPTKYLPLEGRGINSIQYQFSFSIKNQIFEIIDFKNETPSKILKFENTIKCDLDNEFNIGHLVQIDKNSNLNDSNEFIFLFSSNIFYSKSKNLLWKFDSKNSNFVTSFYNERIKKISSGIILTKSGDVYLTESLKIAENIEEIFTFEKKEIGFIHKGKRNVTIHKFPKPNDISLELLYSFDLEPIDKIEIQSTFIALLSKSGKLFITNSQFSLNMKKINDESISKEGPLYYEIDTKDIGFIKNIKSLPYALMLHTINGDVFICGNNGNIGLGEYNHRKSTNGLFLQIPIPSSHPVVDISICSHNGMKSILFLVANPNSNYLLSDIPDEILKCKFCGENYRKDNNRNFFFFFSFQIFLVPTSCKNSSYSAISDGPTTQYHQSI